MSAYDLLKSDQQPDEAELPEQLSGVICRCTGYRNIVEAVADVSREYPDGVPEPHNCGQREPRLPRATLGGAGEPADLEPDNTGDGPAEISIPSGEPTARITVETMANAPIDDIWAVVENTNVLASCLPGAEIVDNFGGDQYKGRMRVSLGPVRLAFFGDVQIVDRDDSRHAVRVIGQAADAASGDVAATVDLVLKSQSVERTELRAVAELHMVGRIAQFGRGLVNDVSRDMFHQFAANIEAASRGEAPTETVPASALSILLTLARTRIKALGRTMTGRK